MSRMSIKVEFNDKVTKVGDNYNFERNIKQELKNLFEEGEILINIIS